MKFCQYNFCFPLRGFIASVLDLHKSVALADLAASYLCTLAKLLLPQFLFFVLPRIVEHLGSFNYRSLVLTSRVTHVEAVAYDALRL